MLLEPATQPIGHAMPVFNFLPDALQCAFGLCGEANYWAGAVALAGVATDQILRKTRDGYTVTLAQSGIDLMIRHLPSDAEVFSDFDDKPVDLWAIEGIAIHVAHCELELPTGIQTRASSADVLTAFKVAAEDAMQMPQMLCFETTQRQRSVAVMALMQSTGTLETLIIKHKGEWIIASALPPWPLVTRQS